MPISSEDRYMNIDPRQLEKFTKAPTFTQALLPQQRTDVAKRIVTAKWSPDEKIVYGAVSEGYTSLDSLPVATGLKEAQVRRAIASLTSRGYVSVSEGNGLGTKAFAW